MRSASPKYVPRDVDSVEAVEAVGFGDLLGWLGDALAVRMACYVFIDLSRLLLCFCLFCDVLYPT